MSQSNRRRVVSGVCLVLLGLFFLTNPLTMLVVRGVKASPGAIALTGFFAPLQMLLFIGGIFGITQLLRHRADRAGLTGAALTLMGWTAGARILAIGQLEALLKSGVTGLPENTLQTMFEAAPLVWASIVPVGILFPLGMTILGITLTVARPIDRRIGVLLTVGAILFPLGRAVRLAWAVTACDLVLGATFALIGYLILTRRQLWPAAESEHLVLEPRHAPVEVRV